MKVLELGCGDGTLWNVDRDKIPEQTEIVVSDISDGMLRDARRTIGADDSRFRFRVFDAGRIPYDKDAFDLVIANHVLFYCEDIPKVCKEVKRVLKPGGRFVCSTYGNDHMREVSDWYRSSMTGSYWQQRICTSVLEKRTEKRFFRRILKR